MIKAYLEDGQNRYPVADLFVFKYKLVIDTFSPFTNFKIKIDEDNIFEELLSSLKATFKEHDKTFGEKEIKSVDLSSLNTTKERLNPIMKFIDITGNLNLLNKFYTKLENLPNNESCITKIYYEYAKVISPEWKKQKEEEEKEERKKEGK